MKKLIISLLIVFFTFTALIILIPGLFKEKITKLVKEEINNSVTAKVEFSDVDLSLLRSFPDLLMSIQKLSVITKDNIVLADIEKFKIEIDLWSVIFGDNIIVNKIYIERPVVNAIYFADGTANWEIFPATGSQTTVEPESSEGSIKISLDEIVVTNADIKYSDRELDMDLGFRDANFNISGDMTGMKSDLQIILKSTGFDFTYEKFTYLKSVAVDFTGGIKSDIDKYEFEFLENKLKLNEFPVEFKGSFAMPGDDMLFDMSFATPSNDFKSLLSIIPAIYSNDFKALETNGLISFDGKLSGVYNDLLIPDFNINLAVNNAYFKYPELPGSVKDININMNVSSSGGNADNTVIDIKSFSARMAESYINSSVRISTPVSNPDLTADIDCKISLSGLKDVIVIEDTDINGKVSVDLNFKTKMSDIENENFENIDADGRIEVSDFIYSSKDMPATSISRMVLLFSPEKAVLEILSGKTGSGDYQLAGYIQNYIPYVINDGVLHGNLSLKSEYFNIDEFLQDDDSETNESDTVSMGIIEIPVNIDFVFDCIMKSVNYDDLVLNNCKGKFSISEGNLMFDNLYTETLGGTVEIDGMYNSLKPEIDIALNITGIDIPSCYNTFNTVKKLAPIASYCSGKISSQFAINSQLDSNMEPVLNTISGKGKLISDKIGIVNLATFNRISETLKLDKFKDPVLKDINVGFTIENGNIELIPFDIKFGEYQAVVSGSQNLDKTVDYTITTSLPTAKVASVLSTLISDKLSGITPENIDVDINITGPINDPEISFDSGKSVSELKQAAKEKVETIIKDKVDTEKQKLKAEAEKKADELLKEAEKQAEAIMKSAQTAADKLISEADKQADALIKAAEKKSAIEKKLAEVSAKKIREEARSKAQKILKEADAKSNKLLADAKEKRQQMLKNL